MLLLAAVAALTAATFTFERPADGSASWRLLRDGQPITELRQQDIVFVTEEQAVSPHGPIVAIRIPEAWREAVRKIRRAPASDTQKQLYIAFLKKTYGYQIAAVNEAYRLDASAFTELESFDFGSLDDTLPKVLADDLEFACEYFAARIQNLPAAGQPGQLRILAFSNSAPLAFVQALAALPGVNAVLFHNGDPQPVKGLSKPLLHEQCPAAKPSFVTACVRI